MKPATTYNELEEQVCELLRQTKAWHVESVESPRALKHRSGLMVALRETEEPEEEYGPGPEICIKGHGMPVNDEHAQAVEDNFRACWVACRADTERRMQNDMLEWWNKAIQSEMLFQPEDWIEQ